MKETATNKYGEVLKECSLTHGLIYHEEDVCPACFEIRYWQKQLKELEYEEEGFKSEIKEYLKEMERLEREGLQDNEED